MNHWFLTAFVAVVLLVLVTSIIFKVLAVFRLQNAMQTKDVQALKVPDAEGDVGLIVMSAVLYFFLLFWNAVTEKARIGEIALYAQWWIDGVRLYLAMFALGLLGLMGLRAMAKKKTGSEFAKRFAVDAPKLKSIRDSLALFSFFLVFFTIIGMVALLFTNPEVRALNGMK